MQEHFVSEIESLKETLLRMASLVDEQVENAFKALETGDIALCKSVKAKDYEVDAYDNLIQTQCENILALFQPLASDLRFIMSSLMINNQLERCGDIAVNITQRVKKTNQSKDLILESKLIEMGRLSRGMIKNAIDSFIHHNTEMAYKVIEFDENVDKLNREIFDFLVAKMQSNPELIVPCSHLIVLARHIERLADHATNIAENVVFYIEAKLITHKKLINSSKNI